jgi:hypothetical protein
MGLLDFVEENSFEEAKKKRVCAFMHAPHPPNHKSFFEYTYICF